MKPRILSTIIIVGGLLLFTNGLLACIYPPIGRLSCSQNMAFVGKSIHFDGSNSMPQSGYITQYHWDFHYDGSFNAEWTDSNSTTDYSYPALGTYIIALVVVNSYDLSSEITSQSIVTVQVNDVIYVDKDANGNNSGFSWENAFHHLQDALDIAAVGDQIWVAQGTYKPDQNSSIPDGTGLRTATFQLKNGVAIYGGFSGMETSLDQRDWEQHQTILSGDVNTIGDNLDNSYHVVKGADDAMLDGFTITKARANVDLAGVSPDNHGGGICCNESSPIIRNCIISGNFAHYGGGMHCCQSSPTITNCLFSDNIAKETGGSIYNELSAPVFEGCRFLGNTDQGVFQVINPSVTLADVDPNWYWESSYGGDGNYIHWEVNDTNYGDGIEYRIRWGNPKCTSQSGLGFTSNALPNEFYVDQDFEIGRLRHFNYVQHNGTSAHKIKLTINLGFSEPCEINESFEFILDINETANECPDPPPPLPPCDDCHPPCCNDVIYFPDSYPRDTIKIYDRLYTLEILGFGPDANNLLSQFETEEGQTSQAKLWAKITPPFARGAVKNVDSNPQFDNCLFVGNNSEGVGGALSNWSCDDVVLNNCTVAFNDGNLCGGIYNRASALEITNTILWGNTDNESNSVEERQLYNVNGDCSVFYSCIQDDNPADNNYSGGDNIYDNPMFRIDPNDGGDGWGVGGNDSFGDLHLLAGSPCIDAGDNDTVWPDIETDLDGNARFFDDPDTNDTGAPPDDAPYVDMGAYEYVPPSLPEGPTVVIVSAGRYEPITLTDALTHPQVQLVGRIKRDDANAIHRTYWEFVDWPTGGDSATFDPPLPAETVEPTSPELVGPLVTLPNAIIGEYYIRLVAVVDGQDDVDDMAVIYVRMDNLAPVVIPGEYNDVNVGEVLQLNGIVYDDGLPNGILLKQWFFDNNNSDGNHIMPDADAIFANPYDPKTSVDFTRDGNYPLKLWASDGDLDTGRFTTIHVVNPDDPPEVNAGADKIICWSQTHQTTMTGAYVSDDKGLDNLTVTWNLALAQNGGTVNWGTWTYPAQHPNQATPIFTRPDTYWLKLEANDGVNSTVADIVKIEVVLPITVYAGPNDTICLPTYASKVHYLLDEARVIGAPEDSVLLWTCTDMAPLFFGGDAPAHLPDFNDANIQNPEVTFYEPGIYELNLTVNHNDITPVSDSAQITVDPNLRRPKKLYAVTDCGNGIIKEFIITPDAQLQFNRAISVTNIFSMPMALAIDRDSEILFFTSDEMADLPLIANWHYLGILNMKDTVPVLETVTLPDYYHTYPYYGLGGAGVTCGLVQEGGVTKKKLFCIGRQKSKLTIYDLSPEGQLLGEPNIITLQDNTGTFEIGGIDIALDEQLGKLYVTNCTAVDPNLNLGREKIYVYDATNPDTIWSSQAYITLDNNAVGIDITKRGHRYLYTGACYHYTSNDIPYYHNYLIRYDLEAPPEVPLQEKEEIIDVGSPVFDVAVDQENGDVYVTTGWMSPYTGTGLIKVYTSDLSSCLASYVTEKPPSGLCILNNVNLSKPATLNLDINDANDNPVLPGQALQYTVRCSMPAGEPNDATNLYIYCDLPRGVDFDGFVSGPNDGEYDQFRHRIMWTEFETLHAGEEVVLRFNVTVNNRAKTMSTFYAYAVAESDQYYSTASHATKVGYWRDGADLSVLYVNRNAISGRDNGSSWEDAYRDLHEALRIAGMSQAEPNRVNRIYIAAGDYSGDFYTGNFVMLSGVNIYGGFAGFEEGPNDRDIRNPKYTTTLRVSKNFGYVVEANNAVIDGFTITGGSFAGVKCATDWAAIRNCVIEGNGKGIEHSSGNVTVQNCVIERNNGNGIDCGGGAVSVENNIIRWNGKLQQESAGVYSIGDSVSSLLNNIIVENLGDGVYLDQPTDVGFYNNTIAYNRESPLVIVPRSYPFQPTINFRNSIVWGNGLGLEIDPCYSESFVFNNCCIDDANYAGQNGNIGDDPCFINAPDFIDVTLNYPEGTGINSFVITDGSRYTEEKEYLDFDYVNDSTDIYTFVPQGYVEIGYDGVARFIISKEEPNDGSRCKISFWPPLEPNQPPEPGTVIRYWGSGGFDEKVYFDFGTAKLWEEEGRECGLFSAIEVNDPNWYAKQDSIALYISDETSFYQNEEHLMVTDVNYVSNKVSFVDGVERRGLEVERRVRIRNFKNWMQGNCTENYHLRPGSPCIDKGAGFGSMDYAAGTEDVNKIVVSDVNFYLSGDVIEIDDDNDTPRFIRDINGTIIAFEPNLESPLESPTPVINWTTCSTFADDSLVFPVYDRDYDCNYIPAGSDSVTVGDAGLYRPGNTLGFERSYDYNDYVVVTGVDIEANTVTFTPSLNNDYYEGSTTFTIYYFDPEESEKLRDVDGNPRLIGDRVDIGADEVTPYQPPQISGGGPYYTAIPAGESYVGVTLSRAWVVPDNAPIIIYWEVRTDRGYPVLESDIDFKFPFNQSSIWFWRPGVYTVYLIVADGISTASDTFTITVDDEHTLSIDPGGPYYAWLSGEPPQAMVTTNAHVIGMDWDDMKIIWRDDQNEAETEKDNVTLSFYAPRTYYYTIKVTDLNDTILASKGITIRIYDVPSTDVNVEAGIYPESILPNEWLPLGDAFLYGNPDNVTLQWSKLRGKGKVTFDPNDNPSNPVTSSFLHPFVKFSEFDDYQLKLQAYKDGNEIDSDTAWVIVDDPNALDTQPPLIQSFTATIDGVSIKDQNDVWGQIVVEAMVSDRCMQSADDVQLKLDGNSLIPHYEYQIDTSVDPVSGCILIAQLSFTRATWEMGAGNHTFTLTAVDSNNNESSQTISFSVLNLASIEKPFASITRPQNLERITTGFYDANGYALPGSGGGDMEYRIELYSPEAGYYDFDPIDGWDGFKNNPYYPGYYVRNVTPDKDANGFHKGSVNGGTFGTLDLTGVQNGIYEMLLTVRKCGSAAECNFANVKFVLDCPLKIGNVKFSQEDLVVPVGGVPIRVIRSYDSLDRNKDGDFGFGWSYSLANMDFKIDEARSDLKLADEIDTDNVRVDDNYNRNVTLTMPDGTKATFMFYTELVTCPVNSGNPYAPKCQKAMYASPPGVNATLRTREDEIWYPVYGGLWNMIGGSTSVPAPDFAYDFSGFELTTEDGTVYHFDRYQDDTTEAYYYAGSDNGIIWANPRGPVYLSEITTPAGERVEFDIGNELYEPVVEGIKCYLPGSGQAAKAIKIERDFYGRIEKIYPPSELGPDGEPKAGAVPALVYNYDKLGNLVGVEKLVDRQTQRYETTTFIYEDANYGPKNHYVTGIKDPRGITPIQYVYDGNGLLSSVIDGRGNEIIITHQTTNRQEVITDRSGNVTIHTYDERGNVISTIYPDGNEVTYDFNDPANPDKPTSVTDQLGNTTTYAYNAYGWPTSVTDPVGNVTDSDYDGNGNVTDVNQYYTNDSNVLVAVSHTHNEYKNGLLTETLVYDPNGTIVSQTKQVYDDNTRLLREVHLIDPTGSEPNIVTTYTYEPANSNSPDQPYSITSPGGQTTYFRYDDNGNQLKSWYHWVDGANECNVYTISVYDAAGRVIETRREVNDVGGDIVASTVVLSQTWYNKIGKVETSVNELGLATEYDYDEAGKLVETRTYGNTDELLTVTRTLYGDDGRVIVTVGPYDPCDANLPVGAENVYDELGRVKETRKWADVEIQTQNITNPQGEKIGKRATGWTTEGAPPIAGNELSYSRNEYDAAGKVSRSITIDEQGYEWPTSYEYDEAGKQTAIIDPCGHDITYDVNGRIVSVELNGTHTTVTHYTGTRRDYVKDACDVKTYFEYDALGRLFKTTYPATTQNPVTYVYVEYDGFGRKALESKQTTKTHEELTNQDTKAYEYDSAGRLSRVWLAEVIDPCTGQYTEPNYVYEYDDFGNMVLQRDPKGRETTFTYDYLNNQISRRLPDGQTEYKAYDEFGRLLKATDFKGQITGFEYDWQGRLEFKKYYANDANCIADEPNSLIEFTYDILGKRLTSTIKEISPAYERCYAYIYDIEGKVETAKIYPTYADYAAETNLLNSIGYDYYVKTGRRSMSRTRDTDVWEDMETQLSYTYDELGRPKTVKIDKRNWWEPENETAVYTYNPVGSRKSLKYPNGNYTEYIYDSLNRLTNLTNYKTDAKTTILSSFSYTHYDNGMRNTLTENVGENRTITYIYDNLNRVTDEEAVNGSGKGYTSHYEYDIAGNRLSRTVYVENTTVGSQTLTTEYAYDPNTDRLLTETHTGPKWAVMLNDRPMYAYAANKGVIYKGSDGEIGEFKAFLLGLPTRLSQYGLGMVLAMLPVAFFSPALMSLRARRPKQSRYSDTDLHRLTRQGMNLWKRCLSVMLAYMMLISPVCLQSLAEGANQYSDLDSRHWAEGDTTVEYTYDDNGSMISKTTKETSSGTILEIVAYEYNLQNRLAKVTTTPYEDGEPQTASIAEYRYDPDGNRVEKNTDGVSTKYFIDSQNLTGYPQVFVEAPEGGNPIVNVIGDDVITQAYGSEPVDIQHLLYDGHGSTRQLSDSEGNLITNESYSYDAYGVMLGGERATWTNLLYTGEQYDSSAEMYYLRARYYDPYAGRFNQIDPYAGNNYDPQSLHKYLYCHANPVNATDPSGEFEFSLVGMLQTAYIVGVISSITAGVYTAVKERSAERVAEAMMKWFVIGFGAAVLIYGGVWLLHSTLVALFGAGAGFGGLKYAEEYGIQRYNDLREVVLESGLFRHHIIEQRFADVLKLDRGNMLAIVVDETEHLMFTSKWREAITYGAGTARATKEIIWAAAQKVYAEYPALLAAAKAELGM